MIKRNISKNWQFKTDNSEYRMIDLPHDYAIGEKRSKDCDGNAGNGFFPNQNGRYVKYLTFEQGKRYILDIDGAYMNTRIFLNENYVAKHPYGYTPFLAELSPYIRTDGTNKLVITTDPPTDSARWYSGNGIYRDVFLWEGGDVRIEPWDLFISTESVEKGQASIKIQFTVSAEKSADIQLHFSITSCNGGYTKDEALSMSVNAGGKTEKEHIITMENPLLWDTEAPHLYTLKTEIFERDTLLDTSVNTFGIRTISADAKKRSFAQRKTHQAAGRLYSSRSRRAGCGGISRRRRAKASPAEGSRL